MKTSLIVAVISGIVFLAGLGILISDWGAETYYTSSGRLQLDSAQWENFKAEIYQQPNVKFKDITMLDSGDIKLVSFQGIKVDKDFQYGELKSHKEKPFGSFPQILQSLCFALGFGVFLVYWLYRLFYKI